MCTIEAVAFTGQVDQLDPALLFVPVPPDTTPSAPSLTPMVVLRRRACARARASQAAQKKEVEEVRHSTHVSARPRVSESSTSMQWSRPGKSLRSITSFCASPAATHSAPIPPRQSSARLVRQV